MELRRTYHCYAQGEICYPLLALQDAIGIPISGRIYDEYVLNDATADPLARELFAAYAELCWRQNGGGAKEPRGAVSAVEWINYFLDDMEGLDDQEHIPLPSNFYAELCHEV